jgi:hypothetical protein
LLKVVEHQQHVALLQIDAKSVTDWEIAIFP